jgi:hypothetical protein
MVSTIIVNPSSAVKSQLAAAQMAPSRRQFLALAGMVRSQPLKDLARENEVSRKFVYAQIEKANRALDAAFRPEEEDDQRVLFNIPVTKQWIRQVVLSAILDCHSSGRGVKDFVRNILDSEIATGTIHNIVMAAVEKARLVNGEEDLSKIRVGVHDEIFQGDPVLVGADPFSTYCYLLAQEPSRDAVTWAVHLLDLSKRGLHPKYTVADAGQGLRAGQAEAWPDVYCRGDVFHAETEMGKMTIYLENRAYGCIGAREDLERKMERARTKSKGQSFSKKLAIARKEESVAIQLIDDLLLLAQWMREDVLSLTGADALTRRELFDFIVRELEIREHLAPHRIRPVRVALEKQRDQLLAFVEDIDRQLLGISEKHQVPLEDVRSLFELGRLEPDDPLYWVKDSALWDRLGHDNYPLVCEAVDQVLDNTVRASSMIENLNSRLRCYFFLRRQVGPEYLELLRFFLNHRRYPRSRKEERAGRSPAEILQGKALPHWLEQLGFTRFRKAA